ncbi:MAG: dihydroneopterin aldolase [Verrucomicrobiales bacterium]|nr:dihydroneopterin aldolase [Verrucomicrobiales bacterium]MCP5525632.1 dihydroneopterin aldolase [Verrucomicrobiales bacterium]
MDTICIEELEVRFHVGVPDEERARPQRLLLSVRMALDMSAAAATDDLSATINYFDVCQRLQRMGEGRSWKLIETLAVEIAELVRREFEPEEVWVEVKKFIIPEARHIAVQVTRLRE